MLLINISVASTVFYFDPGSHYGFGEHSVTWISSLVMFLIVSHVFKITREQLEKYISDKDMTGFYDKIKDGTKGVFKNLTNSLKENFKSLGKKGEEQ